MSSIKCPVCGRETNTAVAYTRKFDKSDILGCVVCVGKDGKWEKGCLQDLNKYDINTQKKFLGENV